MGGTQRGEDQLYLGEARKSETRYVLKDEGGDGQRRKK